MSANSATAFKRLEVADTIDPTRLATFERPRQDDDMLVITTPPGADFHLDAGTLRVIAQVLDSSPSRKEIR